MPLSASSCKWHLWLSLIVFVGWVYNLSQRFKIVRTFNSNVIMWPISAKDLSRQNTHQQFRFRARNNFKPDYLVTLIISFCSKSIETRSPSVICKTIPEAILIKPKYDVPSPDHLLNIKTCAYACPACLLDFELFTLNTNCSLTDYVILLCYRAWAVRPHADFKKPY